MQPPPETPPTLPERPTNNNHLAPHGPETTALETRNTEPNPPPQSPSQHDQSNARDVHHKPTPLEPTTQKKRKSQVVEYDFGSDYEAEEEEEEEVGYKSDTEEEETEMNTSSEEEQIMKGKKGEAPTTDDSESEESHDSDSDNDDEVVMKKREITKGKKP
ncbi:hypothetical protein Drorol1_Dr00028325 [Drosera rotundifolia]